MGTVNLTIEIGNPQGLQFEELGVTAGTRSTYTAVPRATLERLGVPVERTLPSETADGRRIPSTSDRPSSGCKGWSSTPRSYSPNQESPAYWARSPLKRPPSPWTRWQNVSYPKVCYASHEEHSRPNHRQQR